MAFRAAGAKEKYDTVHFCFCGDGLYIKVQDVILSEYDQ